MDSNIGRNVRKDRTEIHLQITTFSRQIPAAEIPFNKRHQTNGFIDKNRQTKIVRYIWCTSQSPIYTHMTQMILLGAVKFQLSIGEMASCASRFYKQLTQIFASMWPFFNHLLDASLTVLITTPYSKSWCNIYFWVINRTMFVLQNHLVYAVI